MTVRDSSRGVPAAGLPRRMPGDWEQAPERGVGRRERGGRATNGYIGRAGGIRCCSSCEAARSSCMPPFGGFPSLVSLTPLLRVGIGAPVLRAFRSTFVTFTIVPVHNNPFDVNKISSRVRPAFKSVKRSANMHSAGHKGILSFCICILII